MFTDGYRAMLSEPERATLNEYERRIESQEIFYDKLIKKSHFNRLVKFSKFAHPHVLPPLAYIPFEYPDDVDDGSQPCYFFYPNQLTLHAYMKQMGGNFTPERALQIAFDVAVAIDHLHRSIPGRHAIFIRHLCPKTVFIETKDGKFVKARLKLQRPKGNPSAGDATDSKETGSKQNEDDDRYDYSCECIVDNSVNRFIYDWRIFADKVVKAMLEQLGVDVNNGPDCDPDAERDPLTDICDLMKKWSKEMKNVSKVENRDLEYKVAEPVFELWELLKMYTATGRPAGPADDGKCFACLKRGRKIWTKSHRTEGCDGRCKFYCSECYSVNVQSLLCPTHYFTGPIVGGPTAHALIFYGLGWDVNDWHGDILKEYSDRMKNVLGHQYVCNIPLGNITCIPLYDKRKKPCDHRSPDKCNCKPQKLFCDGVTSFIKKNEGEDVRFLWIVYIGHGAKASSSGTEPVGESGTGDCTASYNWDPHQNRSPHLQIQEGERDKMAETLNEGLHDLKATIWLPICCYSNFESQIFHKLQGIVASGAHQQIDAHHAVPFHIQLFQLGCSKDCQNPDWNHLRQEMPHGVVCGKIVKQYITDCKDNKGRLVFICNKKIESGCSTDDQFHTYIQLMTDECDCKPKNGSEVIGDESPCRVPLAVLCETGVDYSVYHYDDDKAKTCTLDWKFTLNLDGSSDCTDEHRSHVEEAKRHITGCVSGSNKSTMIVFLKDGMYSRFSPAWEYELQEHLNRECLYYVASSSFEVALTFDGSELVISVPEQFRKTLVSNYKGKLPDVRIWLVFMVIHQHQNHLLLLPQERVTKEVKCVKSFLEALGIDTQTKLGRIYDSAGQENHLGAWREWNSLLEDFQSLCEKENLNRLYLSKEAVSGNRLYVRECCQDTSCSSIVIKNESRLPAESCPRRTPEGPQPETTAN